MSGAFKSRLSKLEALHKRPSRIRSHVVTVDAEGRVLCKMTNRRPVMIVVDHGTDVEWEAALMDQQSKLSGDA